MQIRMATRADAGCLAALNEHVHALHVQAEPTRYRETQLDEVEAVYLRLLDASDWTLLLAFEEGERALGYVALREVRAERSAFGWEKAYLLIDQLAVAPQARRGGVGRALMAAAREHARALGLTRVELDVRAHNQGARAFYEALGFVPTQHRLELELEPGAGGGESA